MTNIEGIVLGWKDLWYIPILDDLDDLKSGVRAMGIECREELAYLRRRGRFDQRDMERVQAGRVHDLNERRARRNIRDVYVEALERREGVVGCSVTEYIHIF